MISAKTKIRLTILLGLLAITLGNAYVTQGQTTTAALAIRAWCFWAGALLRIMANLDQIHYELLISRPTPMPVCAARCAAMRD